MLPKDFPPYSTVHTFYRRCRIKGIWEKVMNDLVEKNRIKMGRNATPSYCLIDSQSVKTTSASEERGIDGGKKNKRHITTDTQGHILHIKVHAANIHDTKGGCLVFKETIDKYPSIQGVCADAGYRKTMVEFVENEMGKTIEISEKITPGWSIIPKRWVVERTFSWLNPFRRLSKDYEITVDSAENAVMIAHSMILIKKLFNS